mmetsp:Transcript_8052/g.24884  ORF Transcript_8052/g.24884 Transcript_8052/m.24884 type:complete len:215 (-) Transcript_8052:725-1369(-)
MATTRRDDEATRWRKRNKVLGCTSSSSIGGRRRRGRGGGLLSSSEAGAVRRRDFLSKEAVDSAVEEHTGDADEGADDFRKGQVFLQDDADTDNNDCALGGVGDGLGDGVGFLDGHGGEFVVGVEVGAGEEEVVHDGGRGLEGGDEVGPLAAFGGDEHRKRHEEGEDGGDGELVADGAEAVLEAGRVHEFLVLVALDGREQIRRGRRDQRGDRKV